MPAEWLTMRSCAMFLLVSLTACSQFVSQPISQTANTRQIRAAHPEQTEFKHYLQTVAPHIQWPIRQWELETLTYAALYFHPALKVAKSDYAVALAGITAAGIKPKIGLNGQLSQSNQANGDISPFAYGLQIDIPVITAGKRQISIDIAQYQADIAKIPMSEAAWQLRQQIAQDMLTRSELTALLQNTQQLLEVQNALLKAWEKRLAAGMAGKTELLPLQLQYEQTRWQYQEYNKQLVVTEQNIVHDAGLTGKTIAPVSIAPLSTPALLQQVERMIEDSTSPLYSVANMQDVALTNRMDIQRGLAQYAQAENKLKLEIAKLKPDIHLSPGIAYEFGDKLWSLGIGGLLNLLNPSTALWKQAEAVRENEADRFYALQHSLIHQCEKQHLQLHQAYLSLKQLNQEAALQPQRQLQLQQQWQKGLIDKTEWLQSQVLFYQLQQRLITQQMRVLRAALDIENTMQKPMLISNQTMPDVSQMTREKS